jgi:hypothetical protein
MTAELKPTRDPADAELFDHIGVILHGTREIAAYMRVSPATIVRWRRSFRGREEPRLCFPAMLIPGRGRQWRMVTNTRSIARWMERWAEIDAGNAQAKARWRRKPPKTKRLDETQTAEVRPPIEGESRRSLREDFYKLRPAEQAWVFENELTPAEREELGVKFAEIPAASPPPASKEPCPCGLPSRCLVQNGSPLEEESPRPMHDGEPPTLAPLTPAPPANRRPGMVRPEGCMCGKGLICAVCD